MLAAADECPATAPLPCQRRVLLAVTGLTPQIVTETLYALMREGADALPHEVHILTTAEGAERARLALSRNSTSRPAARVPLLSARAIGDLHRQRASEYGVHILAAAELSTLPDYLRRWMAG